MKFLQYVILLSAIFNCCFAYRLPNDGSDNDFTDLAEAVLREGKQKSEEEATEENESFTDVTNKEQLWRFMVGEGSSLSIGDKYICLRTYKDNFLYSSAEHVYQGRMNCWSGSRFIVEFVGQNEVNLKSENHKRYLSCANDGWQRTTEWKDDSAIFQIRINENEDEIVLFNPSAYGALAITGSGAVDCNGYESEPSAKFYGWKLGPKEAWEAKDNWQHIATFDNRYSDSKTNFAYRTSVGIRRAKNTKAAVVKDLGVDAGPDMYQTFIKSIGTDTDIDWESTPSNVWDPAVPLKTSTEVEPHKISRLYQAVGQYGIFTIYTNYIQARGEDETLQKEINLLEAEKI